MRREETPGRGTRKLRKKHGEREAVCWSKSTESQEKAVRRVLGETLAFCLLLHQPLGQKPHDPKSPHLSASQWRSTCKWKRKETETKGAEHRAKTGPGSSQPPRATMSSDPFETQIVQPSLKRTEACWNLANRSTPPFLVLSEFEEGACYLHPGVLRKTIIPLRLITLTFQNAFHTYTKKSVITTVTSLMGPYGRCQYLYFIRKKQVLKG